MNTSGAYAHGGDVEGVARASGIAPELLLDFSSNVNPAGLPARALDRLARDARDPRNLSQYPSPGAPELRRLLSERVDVQPECIVIGAGADSLIHAAVRALAPKRCVIPVPAFSEYARACRAYGCAIHTIAFNSEFSARNGDLVIINNPHNPTGNCLSRTAALNRIASARAAGATVMIDEAFIDYQLQSAVTRDAAALPGVVSIRSLTKFFGCPGLRVGYAVAEPDTARALAEQLPPWPVTTLALNALAEALTDLEFARATLRANEEARSELADALAEVGCTVNPSAANFLFLRLPGHVRAGDVRERLIHDHAIIVRECDSFEGIEPGRHLRVAVRRPIENQRLVDALRSVVGERSCH